MASDALGLFKSLMDYVEQLVEIHGSVQTGRGRRHRQEALHRAGVVMTVAAWESYMEFALLEGFEAIALAASAPAWSRASFKLSEIQARQKAGDFHTPNAENVRRLFMQTIGYDPWSDWTYVVSRRNWQSPEMRGRLDEWLRIRHAVAHGGPLPENIPWIKSPQGESRLTLDLLRECRRFFARLVQCTDEGFSHYLQSEFGIAAPW